MRKGNERRMETLPRQDGDANAECPDGVGRDFKMDSKLSSQITCSGTHALDIFFYCCD